MDATIRKNAQINWIRETNDGVTFSQFVLDITGNFRAAQIYYALRYQFGYLIDNEQIDKNGWFYWDNKYVQRRCGIDQTHISRYTKILIEHGLLERKTTYRANGRGKINYYRFPDSTLESYVQKTSLAILASEKCLQAKLACSPQPLQAKLACSPQPDDLTGNPDTSLIDENSSRARTLKYNIKNKKHMDARAHPTKSLPPKNSKSGGVLLTVPSYSKNDMKCAQFCFETICKNFPKSNAAKAGWDSLRDEWSAIIDKLAKKFTEGNNKRVQAALKWAFGPRNRRNSFLQENIRSLPMLLTKKWKTSDEMEFTFDRLLRDFDASTESSIEDDIDTQLRIECKKVLAEYEDPKCTVDDIMTWVEYLQQEIDNMNDMLPSDKRSMWHHRNSMAKVVKWITDIVECFVGCSRYPDADSYVETFIERTKEKIRAGKLKFLWPGYFSDDADDYSAFERAAVDNYPGIFG